MVRHYQEVLGSLIGSGKGSQKVQRYELHWEVLMEDNHVVKVTVPYTSYPYEALTGEN